MGLKEILAAKKAAAEKEAKENGNVHNEAVRPESITTNTENAELQNKDVAVHQVPNASVQSSAPANVPAKDEVLVDANGKPLSGFALVKRRKELAAQQAQGIVNEAKKEEAPASSAPSSTGIVGTENASGQDTANATKQEVPVSAGSNAQSTEVSVVPDDIPDFSHEAYLAATPESKQAYSDLKMRIDGLISLQDTDLKNAMTELKKALMQNTNAVALMLPSDIGQMVIALRKMTGVELAKAEEKKTGKKAGKVKEPILSAEALEAAFQEL